MINFLVYVVEDDEDDRQLLESIFTDFFDRYELRFFEHGAHLLTHLTHQFDRQLPDLILLDLAMPVLNGFDTLRYLKNNPDYKRIPTLVLASSRHPNDINRCYELGSNAFITKPRKYYQWIAMIDQLQANWLGVIQNSAKPNN